jgi:hypothetical protein
MVKAWLPDPEARSWWRRQSHQEPAMNAKQTALDAYLAHMAAIRAKLVRNPETGHVFPASIPGLGPA